MTIEWGEWKYSGGNGMRVGINLYWSEVFYDSTSVLATAQIFTQNQATYTDNQALTFGGSISGSFNYNNTQSGSPTYTLRTTKTYEFFYSDSSYGVIPWTRTFSAQLSGAYNGVTPSVSLTKNIPIRPSNGSVTSFTNIGLEKRMPKVWDGSNWTIAQFHVWNGIEWKDSL